MSGDKMRARCQLIVNGLSGLPANGRGSTVTADLKGRADAVCWHSDCDGPTPGTHLPGSRVLRLAQDDNAEELCRVSMLGYVFGQHSIWSKAAVIVEVCANRRD